MHADLKLDFPKKSFECKYKSIAKNSCITNTWQHKTIENVVHIFIQFVNLKRTKLVGFSQFLAQIGRKLATQKYEKNKIAMAMAILSFCAIFCKFVPWLSLDFLFCIYFFLRIWSK